MYIEGVGLTDYKIWSEYIIMSLFLFATIKYIYEYSKTKERFLLLISVSLLISIYSEMAFVLYISVYDIFNYLGHIYKFIAFFIIFRAIFINNIQRPYLELYKAKQELRHYADNLDMLVHKRTEELKQLNDKLLEDLDYARDIQKALFPTKIPRWGELSFEMGYFPAERVSGDFYNIFEVDSENVAFYIGDVSGHGVPAAMLTVFLNQTMKVLVDDWMKKEKGVDILDPSQVLSSIYKSFNMTNFKEEVYIVMLYGIYNIQTRKLTYSSAGFNTQPIVIRQPGEVFDIDIKGFPICKLIEFFSGEYENSFIILEPKDKILFYTDGLIEANNKDGCFYEDKRLVDLLKKNYQKPAAKMCQLISDSVFEFIDGNQPKDDITFFIMEVGSDKN
jgi:sigma-B regulation protein RsbU (phosphoserine phosphatase)